MQGFVKSFSDSLNGSFVLALSKRKIYGVITADITVNAMKFQRFFEEMLTKRNEDPYDSKVSFILVMDSNSIHNAKQVQAYLKSTKVLCMAIA